MLWLIFLFVFGVMGMTNIIVESDMPLIVWFRDLVDKYLSENISKMIHCLTCTGFWCGLFCGWSLFDCTIIQIFLAGCAGSALSNFMGYSLSYVEAQTFLALPPQEQNGK